MTPGSCSGCVWWTDRSTKTARARSCNGSSTRPGRGRSPSCRAFSAWCGSIATKHSADVTSAVPLPPDIRALLEAGVARLYGPGIVTSFAEDPALLGGVRVTVGSDVYDGTIKAGLAALEARF